MKEWGTEGEAGLMQGCRELHLLSSVFRVDVFVDKQSTRRGSKEQKKPISYQKAVT